ncbi:hypothetical protein J3A64_000188 [Pseudarthrobacter sp. PvP004]|uniref:VanZ family protein n=1 Tax=Pseudarthrobacter sp. PvP004 TaxID=2817850 RepID=UPI002570DC1F|nr:VanZ family protein [Pseudarthrobacter sp. PvP004]MBP2264724.1 hypothetical protein [Pseudarthrobacter sp. PvP004]
MKNPLPWRVALAAYLAGFAMVGFWPTPVDQPIHGTLTAALKHLHELGGTEWFDYHFVEASANVVMFIPLGTLAAMGLPAVPWWRLVGIGFAASVFVELGQLLFITDRFSSHVDVVTNTSGAVIGILSARVVDRRIIPKLTTDKRVSPLRASRSVGLRR